MSHAEHTNENGQHCCPVCMKSNDYGIGHDDVKFTVRCHDCGKPFVVWTELRPHQCSASLLAFDSDELAEIKDADP